jgi:cation:H+ antiporter
VAASIAAAIEGNGDAAIGNVYGSNIANLALVGGLVALIRPLRIKKLTLQREIPVMLIAGLILWPVLRSSYLSRPEGAVLLGVFAALILLTVYIVRKDKILATEDGEVEEMKSGFRGNDIKKSILFVFIGLVGLALGAKMTVKGAVFVGGRIGLSDAVIGLTIIAIGTSLPELATCVVAAVRAQHDISIGNLVGSNIFNTLLVTGMAGTVRPFAIVDRLAAGGDYWIMIGVSAAFAGLAVIGKRIIGRLAGSILLCTYIAYMIYLFLFSK